MSAETEYARGAREERERLAWWLRAGASGPASVSTEPAVLDSMRELATVLEEHPERWAQAPVRGS